MSKLGRPPEPPDETLSYTLSVPVTPAHRAQLEREARAAGYRSLAAYLRERRLSTTSDDEGSMHAGE